MKNRTLTLNAGKVEPVRLVSLAYHNERASEAYRRLGEPKLNGIECPGCASELYDSSPSITLTTSPPAKHIHCENCDYRGTALT